MAQYLLERLDFVLPRRMNDDYMPIVDKYAADMRQDADSYVLGFVVCIFFNFYKLLAFSLWPPSSCHFASTWSSRSSPLLASSFSSTPPWLTASTFTVAFTDTLQNKHHIIHCKTITFFGIASLLSTVALELGKHGENQAVSMYGMGRVVLRKALLYICQPADDVVA